LNLSVTQILLKVMNFCFIAKYFYLAGMFFICVFYIDIKHVIMSTIMSIELFCVQLLLGYNNG